MSEADTMFANAADGHDEHASGHDDVPVDKPLGPVDLTTWAYAIGGSVVGVVIALAMLAARGG